MQEPGAEDVEAEDLSFEEVAEELSWPLGRYLQRVAMDQHLAEDLLQETLLRIARGLPGFDGRSSLKTWAYTIATRTALDHFRKGGASPPSEELDLVELPDDAPTPEQRLALDQMNQCIREVIASLPDDYRIAVLLHDFGDLSAREIAVACGCSLATAKVRIHRARAKVKAALKNECALYRDADQVLRCHRKD
ncbi:MAG TPA: sigma-70 family RNA polymerase sigma factor [Rhodocyclaceae bacterium]